MKQEFIFNKRLMRMRSWDEFTNANDGVRGQPSGIEKESSFTTVNKGESVIKPNQKWFNYFPNFHEK